MWAVDIANVEQLETRCVGVSYCCLPVTADHSQRVSQQPVAVGWPRGLRRVTVEWSAAELLWHVDALQANLCTYRTVSSQPTSSIHIVLTGELIVQVVALAASQAQSGTQFAGRTWWKLQAQRPQLTPDARQEQYEVCLAQYQYAVCV